MTKPVLKPVWRVNMGIEPKDSFGMAFVRGEEEPHGDEGWTWNWELEPDFDEPVIAYQTTRTKAAKYRDIECKSCEGEGRRFGEKGILEGDCQHCSGKGHNLEKIK